MARERKIKEMCFCLMPGIVGIIMIIYSIAHLITESNGINNELSWTFLWIFLALVLISHTIISVIAVCKRE